jgi:hypothetical protein
MLRIPPNILGALVMVMQFLLVLALAVGPLAVWSYYHAQDPANVRAAWRQAQ